MASLLLILAAGFSWIACGDEPPAPAGGGETPEEPGGGNEEPEDTLSEQEKEFLQIEFDSPTEADADNGFAATVRFTLEGERLPRGVADWGVAVSVNRENLEKRPEQWISTLVTGKELPVSNFNILTLKGLYGKETYYCRPYIQSQEGTMKWGGIARFTTPEEVFFISQKDSSSNSIMEGSATIETNASSAVLGSRFQKVEAKLVDVSLDKSQFSLNYYETEPSGVNRHSLKWLSEDLLQVSFTHLPPQASVSFKVAIECDGVQKYLSPTYLVTSRELPETGMVDLGLAVHWAACNLGASSPWDTGSYMTFDEAQAADEADGSWRLPNESDITQLTNRCQFIPVYLGVLLSPEHSDYLGEIIIEGHTDTSGDYLMNLELSQERALSVATYCLQMPQLSKDQLTLLRSILTAKGRSYSDPIYGEDGKIDMDASRRVEFKFRLKDSEMIDEMRDILKEYEAAEGGTQ